MNRDVLLEIGVEELPLSCMKQLLSDMQNAFRTWLDSNFIVFEDCSFSVTPRRLVFYIKNVEPKQRILPEKVKGPPVRIAIKDGSPTKALQGFLQKCKTDSYTIESIKGQEYVFCVTQPVCDSIEIVLKNGFPKWLQKYPFSVTMKWNGFVFVRPIRWICSMYGDKLIPISMMNITAGIESKGLRGFPRISIQNAQDYFSLMESNHICINTEERINRIKSALPKNAPGDIIEKNALCTEWPVVCRASFSDDLLDIPKEAVKTMIEDHLICFTSQDSEGKLQPEFFFVMNGPRNEKKVALGYTKVITAKLEDAKFFYQQDRRIPLADYSERIGRIVFMKGLGTVLQKTKRLEALAEKYSFDVEKKKLLRATYLLKMDLPTHMVTELPELQGTMGRIYALLDNEDTSVAEAIEDAYSPRRESDSLPTTNIGKVLSILDRIDTLAGAFAIHASVTGSADPLGLRRTLNGLFRILYNESFDISVSSIFSTALQLYQEMDGMDFDYKEVLSNIDGFYTNRLSLFLGQYHRYDLVEAVMINDFDNPFLLQKKITLLEKWIKDPAFKILCESFTRIKNITKEKYLLEPIDESLLEDKEEKELYKKWKEVKEFCEEEKDLSKKIPLYVTLNPFIENFFDSVLVNCENNCKKVNRLRFISWINFLYLQFCNFSKIVFQGGNNRE